jgi:hypothetical protein
MGKVGRAYRYGVQILGGQHLFIAVIRAGYSMPGGYLCGAAGEDVTDRDDLDAFLSAIAGNVDGLGDVAGPDDAHSDAVRHDVSS